MIKFFSIVFPFCLAALFSCSTSADLTPQINTGEITVVTQTSAYCSAAVLTDGGSTITERGICWSANPNPTIKNNHTSGGEGTGSFQDSLQNLNAGTTYYVRAYATNTNDTYYGQVLQLTTAPDTTAPDPVLNNDLTYGTATDIDGNLYHTINIGTQTWMVENLVVTRYRNGDLIPNVTDNTQWQKLTSGAQCVFNNNTEVNSINKFGRFYNFYAVADSRNIAPQGWHVATGTDWNLLVNYLTANPGTSHAASQAMAAKTDWTESSIAGSVGYIDQDTYTSLNNSSGFSCLPAGFRGNYGMFDNVGAYCAWWTADSDGNSTAQFCSLNYYSTTLNSGNVISKRTGLSVRCVKN